MTTYNLASQASLDATNAKVTTLTTQQTAEAARIAALEARVTALETPVVLPPPSTVLFQEAFADTNWASRGWYDQLTAQISADALALHYPAGASTPVGLDTAMRHLFAPTPTLYVGYQLKYSDNWVGSGQGVHPHELMVLSDLDPDSGGLASNWLAVYLEHNYQAGAIPRIAVQDNKAINTTQALPSNLIGVTENRSTCGCNGVWELVTASECYAAGGGWYNDKKFDATTPAFPRGVWTHVEWYLALNSVLAGIGQSDGIAQCWVNGVLVIDRHTVLYRTGARPTLQFKQFCIAPYMNASPVDQTTWLDSLVVATARP